MTTAPHLVRTDGGYRLDVALGRRGRRRFALSDRAEALLVDDLGYGDHDLLPGLTTRAVVLAGGAYRRDGKTGPRELAWSVTGADGAPRASDAEVDRLAAYLCSVEMDHGAVETLGELVDGTRLSAAMSPDDVRSRRDRTNGLRGIAKDL